MPGPKKREYVQIVDGVDHRGGKRVCKNAELEKGNEKETRKQVISTWPKNKERRRAYGKETCIRSSAY